MKDEKELFDISTRLIEGPINALAKDNGIGPAEVTAILTIVLGRIVGKMGYRHMTKDEYWQEITKHGKVLYGLGFDSERQEG